MPELAVRGSIPVLPCWSSVNQGGRQLHQLRRGTRWPVQRQLLHSSSNAPGAQVGAIRTPDDVEAIVRANPRRGGDPLLVMDETSSPDPQLGADLDRADRLCARTRAPDQGSSRPSTCVRQIISWLHREGGAGLAGTWSSSGLETSIRNSLMGAKKSVRTKIWEYREMLDVATRQGHDLVRLHPRLPDRHAGVDRP